MKGVGLLAFIFVAMFGYTQAPDTLWTRTYGGTNYDGGQSVQETADGGFIIAGETYSFGAGSGDVYLIRTDADGDTLWTRTYGGGDLDYGWSVQQTADSGYITAGGTYSFGAGSADVYLIKTEPDVGVAEQPVIKTAQTETCLPATIFRGPLQLPEGKQCKVFDITGRVVEPSNITRGIYFIEMDGVVMQKVVKVR